MAGGGLIITKHKSWNPYGREQRARVEKDERLHAEKQRVEERRQKQVDAELRMGRLRARSSRGKTHPHSASFARNSQNGTGSQPAAHGELGQYTTQDGHINLFADIENGTNMHVNTENKDAQVEKKLDEEKQMKKLGVAPWKLGDMGKESAKAWYIKQSKEQPSELSISDLRQARDASTKSWMDPLQTLAASGALSKYSVQKRLREAEPDDTAERMYALAERSMLWPPAAAVPGPASTVREARRRKHHRKEELKNVTKDSEEEEGDVKSHRRHNRRSSRNKRERDISSSSEDHSENESGHERKKRGKSHHRHHHHRSSSKRTKSKLRPPSHSPPQDLSTSDLEKLRQERLERERKERIKATAVLDHASQILPHHSHPHPNTHLPLAPPPWRENRR